MSRHHGGGLDGRAALPAGVDGGPLAILAAAVRVSLCLAAANRRLHVGPPSSTAAARETAGPVADPPRSKGVKLQSIQRHGAPSGDGAAVGAAWRLPLLRIVIARWLIDVGAARTRPTCQGSTWPMRFAGRVDVTCADLGGAPYRGRRAERGTARHRIRPWGSRAGLTSSAPSSGTPLWTFTAREGSPVAGCFDLTASVPRRP